MDALSDVLRVAHLSGGVFLHADFFAPWCMAARVGPEHCAPALGPASHLILYHYIVEGELRIRLEGGDGEGLVLGAGGVVLWPCDATLKHCRRGRPGGSPACATLTLRGRWRCCITRSPDLGT